MQPFQYDLRSSAAKDNSITHAAAAPSNLDAATTMRFAASRSKPEPIYGRGNTKWQQSCSHSNAICHHSFKKRIELRTQEQPLVAKHIGGTIRDKRPQPHPPHTRGTFHRRLQPLYTEKPRFRAPASSPQHSPCNIHAAITLRFAASRSKPAPIYGRGNTKWQSCSHSNAICHHSFKKRIELRTQEQPLVAKHIGGTIRDRNDRSRTRRTDEVPFIVACSHFTRKNTRFRAPASSPQHSPCNIHAAITLRFAASRSKPAPIYGRGNTEWQQSCSHSNAICHHSFKKRIELRTQEQPLVAKHIGGTIRDRNDRSRTRRTDEVPFIVACSHFTRKNTRFRAPASSPTHHFPSSPLPIVTTSHRHHLPSSTSLPHYFPFSPLPIVPTSLPHHSPSSSLPFVTTSHRHHFPSSPLPFVTTSHRHHFPSSPLPFVTTSLRHHFPSSPLPIVTTSLRHHFPSSPLPFVTTRHYHHPSSKSIPLLLILLLCIVMLCIVMWSTTLHHFTSQNSICP